MTMQPLKLAGREYVLVGRKDFARLRDESEKYRLLKNEDAALAELGKKRLAAHRRAGSKGVGLEQVKRELGL
ncbi:MAG: hypothetical protein ABSH20_11840 [Tepidisphaeraceae bacterium]|jgi:hypothetical protein